VFDHVSGRSDLDVAHRQRQQRRVLVLEDEPDFRRVLVELLAGEGFEVTTCDSYAALWSADIEHDPAVVLADFWGTSHIELSPCERDEIRALGGQVPTILLTGRAWALQADAADLNVNCILAKPVVLDDILEQIRRCLT
jgi:CheY-like chemotaxis protein